MRTNWISNTGEEDSLGTSIAVQLGNSIETSAILSLESNTIIGIDDVVLQTEFIIKKIEYTLHQSGMVLSDLVRLRVYVTDISMWPKIANVYKYLLSDCAPAITVLEVSALIHPKALLAIEATALKE